MLATWHKREFAGFAVSSHSLPSLAKLEICIEICWMMWGSIVSASKCLSINPVKGFFSYSTSYDNTLLTPYTKINTNKHIFISTFVSHVPHPLLNLSVWWHQCCSVFAIKYRPHLSALLACEKVPQSARGCVCMRYQEGVCVCVFSWLCQDKNQ